MHSLGTNTSCKKCPFPLSISCAVLDVNELQKLLQSPCSSLCTHGLAPGEGGGTAISVMQQPVPVPAAVGENIQKGRQIEVHWAEELLRGVVESARDLSRHISVLGWQGLKKWKNFLSSPQKAMNYHQWWIVTKGGGWLKNVLCIQLSVWMSLSRLKCGRKIDKRKKNKPQTYVPINPILVFKTCVSWSTKPWKYLKWLRESCIVFIINWWTLYNYEKPLRKSISIIVTTCTDPRFAFWTFTLMQCL